MTDRNEHGFPIHPEIDRMAEEDAGGFVYGGLTWQTTAAIVAALAAFCVIIVMLAWA